MADPGNLSLTIHVTVGEVCQSIAISLARSEGFERILDTMARIAACKSDVSLTAFFNQSAHDTNTRFIALAAMRNAFASWADCLS
jgi:hypothetical protein